jgi:hypothetical protein
MVFEEESLFKHRVNRYVECLDEIRDIRLDHLDQRIQLSNREEEKEEFMVEILWDEGRGEAVVDYKGVFYRAGDVNLRELLDLLGLNMVVSVSYPVGMDIRELLDAKIENILVCQLVISIPINEELEGEG